MQNRGGRNIKNPFSNKSANIIVSIKEIREKKKMGENIVVER